MPNMGFTDIWDFNNGASEEGARGLLLVLGGLLCGYELVQWELQGSPEFPIPLVTHFYGFMFFKS